MPEDNNGGVLQLPKMRLMQKVHCIHHQKVSRYEILIDEENFKVYVRCLECPKYQSVIAEFNLAKE